MPLSVNSHAEFKQELLQNNMTGKVMRNLIENCDYHTIKQNALDLEMSVPRQRYPQEVLTVVIKNYTTHNSKKRVTKIVFVRLL